MVGVGPGASTNECNHLDVDTGSEANQEAKHYTQTIWPRPKATRINLDALFRTGSAARRDR